jgi:hypothetical protein
MMLKKRTPSMYAGPAFASGDLSAQLLKGHCQEGTLTLRPSPSVIKAQASANLGSDIVRYFD